MKNFEHLTAKLIDAECGMEWGSHFVLAPNNVLATRPSLVQKMMFIIPSTCHPVNFQI